MNFQKSFSFQSTQFIDIIDSVDDRDSCNTIESLYDKLFMENEPNPVPYHDSKYIQFQRLYSR